MTDKVEKTEEQWRKELTPEQYRVLREAGTERAFTGAYWDNHGKGVTLCRVWPRPFQLEIKLNLVLAGPATMLQFQR